MLRSLLWLRIGAAGITAAGAALALFGETRGAAGLTAGGYIAIVLVGAGFAATTAIELVQAHIDRKKEVAAAFEQRVSEAWHLAERQPIASVAIHFCQRHEIPVLAFMRYLSPVAVRLRFLDDGNMSVTDAQVAFSRSGNSSNLEQAYCLAVSKNGLTIATGNGVNLAARTVRKPRTSVPYEPPPKLGPAPNPQSENPRQFSSAIPVAEVTLICGDWEYRLAGNDPWLSSERLACGIRASVPWGSLQLGPRYQTIADLGQMLGVAVILPAGFDLRIVDWFELSLATAGGLDATIDLKSCRYTQRDDGSWETFLRGSDLYALAKTRVLKDLRRDESATARITA